MKRQFFTLLFAVLCTTAFSQKNVLVEELTGTWCHYCPSGIYYGDSLVQTHENVILVQIHTSDVMTYDEYVTATNLTGAPTANIGRNFLSQGVDSWFSKAQAEMQIEPKVSLNVVNQYDETTRLLTSTITSTVLENMSGAYRLGAIVIEDAVTGPAPQYDQSNAYSGGNYGPMGGFENLPNPIPAHRMAYDHVARYLMGGYSGAENSFPTSATAGQTIDYTFTYTLPENYNADNVRVIGILVAQSDGKIDNAAKSSYLNGYDNAAPIFTSNALNESFLNLNYLYNIYTHDTEGETMTITATEKPSWLTFEQYDNKSAVIYGVPTEVGNYNVVLEVSDGNHVTTQEFVITVNAPLDGQWMVLGERGFMESGDYVLDMCVDHQGILYTLVREAEQVAVYRNDPTNGEWIKMDLEPTTISSAGSIAVNAQNEVYITYSTTSDQIIVKKWNGSVWENVGNLNKTGMNSELAIDANGVVYMVFMDFSANYLTYLYQFDNNEWSMVGGASFTDLTPAWAKIAIDHQNVPNILWTDFYGGCKNYVSKFDGSWSLVGGGTLSDQFGSYYYQDIDFDADGIPYVAFCVYGDNSLISFKFVDNAWQLIGENIADGGVNSVDLDFDSDNHPVIAYGDLNMENKVSVKILKDGVWSYIGQRGCSEGGSSYAQLTMWNDVPYVTFRDEAIENNATCIYYASTQILLPPTDFSAMVENDRDVLLTWTAPNDTAVLSYNIYKNDVFLENVSATQYLDEGLANGIYRYTLTAVYEAGESVAVGPEVVEIAVEILYPPTNFSAIVVDENDVLLSWDAPENASVLSYHIYRNDALLTNSSETEFTDSDLENGSYTYTVTAVYEAGESDATQPQTVVISVNINELNDDLFKCYPTMVSDVLVVESETSGWMEIYSVEGKCVEKLALNQGKTNINVSRLLQGVYFVVFKTIDQQKIEKVVKL
ncbi:MAG: Omp28-related outer membrane protein [Bacteroidales bacterium]|nr:Omp28-related outer membrane protein [Bacteroidales bacterium]